MYKNNKVLLSTVLWLGTLLWSALFSSLVKAESVDKLIKTLMKERHIPGLQLAVIKDEKVVKQGSYGFADLQHQVPVTEQTLFPINSMTKAFTGVAIVQLAEQGYLNIDDEIGKHLPELPEAWQPLKINQLMGHTTGLPPILELSAGLETIVPNDAEASWQAVQKQPFQFTPNSRFSYNQTGYVILGKIIDKYVPEGFPAFITKMQLVRANMPQTAQAGFDYLERMVPHQARQYIHLGEGNYKNFYGEFPYILRTAAGMSSTATELANYLVSLQQGKLVKELDMLWTPVKLNNGRTEAFNNKENGYAMGWQVTQRKYHPAISASGGDAVTVITYPEDKVSVIVLTNLLGGLPITFVDDIAAYYIPEFNEPSKQKAYQPMAYLSQLTDELGFSNFAATFATAQQDTGVMYDLEILVEWGNNLVENGQVNNGIEIFKFVLTQNNEQPYYHSSIAQAYELNKQYAQAFAHYQQLLTISPNSQFAKNKMAEVERYL
ncbi:serine hydrolase domain-containing protein [Pseudoalteromonas sp. PS5]|uniref:serine hydrolase domain-containing protein n=1 Tax=Pseudoalteromonas sp. PS5 TaxID=1437473 RepID=UPI000FFE579E|nr:serine hydrolase domain-containing protein [Pseudoalteromonas sp. PS5]RXF01754.1 serine hydrolase [Pseudoalteromonas sp. PS5]